MRQARSRRRIGAGVTSLVLAALLLGGGCRRDRERSLAQLASSDPSVRVTALERLADTATDADLQALAMAAKDPSPEVRRAAVLALGKRKSSAAIDRVGEAVADPDPTVQRTAIAALADSDDEKARAWLLTAYSRRGPAARESIVAALGRRGIPPVDAVKGEADRIWDRDVQALEKGSLAERAGAAEELGRSGRDEVLGILGALLSDESTLVAAAAARGLGASGNHEALPLLIGLLGDPSPPVRDAAAEALGMLGDPRAIDPLAVVARSGSTSALLAARSLSRLPGSTGAACEAARAVQDGTVYRVLAEHARSGGAACDTGRPTDGAASREGEGRPHGESIEHAGDLEASRPAAGEGESALDALLRRVDGWREKQAKQGGAKDAGPDSAHLRSLLFHDRPEVRAETARTLAKHPDPQARPMLEALAQADFFVEVRKAAAEALRTVPAK